MQLCNFLLVISSNLGFVLHQFGDNDVLNAEYVASFEHNLEKA